MRTCTLVSARPLLVQEYRLRDISGWPTPQGWAHYTEKRQGLRCLNGLMSGLVAFQCLIQPFDQLADLRLLCAERAVLLVTAGQHFVGDIQCRHDGDALNANHLAAVADVAHRGVEVACGLS